MIGERLGRYLIEERLGAGGMGTVYRARDPHLQRTVAIKVVTHAPQGDDLTAALAEARAASALNHPNICTVHEVGEQGPLAYIVEEYVEGRPLSQIVPHDGLSAETVVRYGVQIADALAHAHDHGVVHRDLKSANVVIARDGRPKVLDFGLARRVAAAGGDDETRSASAETGSGRLAGTLAYMAPEQLVGAPGGQRSDVWSFGVLLHEMASGALPFQGRNQYEVTASILRSTPEPLPATVPPMLRAIIGRCLAKEPDQRYQRASEARAALEAIQSNFGYGALAAPERGPHRYRRWLLAGGTAGGLALATLVLVPRDELPRWARTAEAGRLSLLLSADSPQYSPVISPDARLLAYVSEDADEVSDVFIRQTTSGRPIRLTNDAATEWGLSFSPDGQTLAFTRRERGEAQPEVCVLPALGGDMRCILRPAGTPAWSPAGDRLAFIRPAGADNPFELVVAAADGSNPAVVLTADGAHPFMRNPAWSPDGRHLAVVRSSGGIAGQIWLVPVAGGAPRRLSDDPGEVFSDSPVFTPDGLGLIHSSNRGGATNVWFQPLDGGAPIRLTAGAGPDESPSIARDGTIVFINTRWRSALVLHDLGTGESQVLARHSSFIWAPTFAPDDNRIVFSRREVDGSWHLWTLAADGSQSRLTETLRGEIYPRFTPDGASVLFTTWTQPASVWSVPAGGGPPVQLTHLGDTHVGYADVSPDGRWIAYTQADADSEHIYVASADGGQPRELLSTPATLPRWSPDGQRIAFSPHRGSTGGIFVVDVTGGMPDRLTDLGGWPVWWRDGSRVAYLATGPDGNQEIRTVPAGGGAWARLEGPRFRGTNFPFDVSRDGRRIVTSNGEHVLDEIWMLVPPR